MIGIEAIGTFIPHDTKDNIARCKQFGKDEQFIREKIGFVQLPRKEKNMETSDLCVAAYEALVSKLPIDVDRIDCILVVTQNPDGYGLPHTAALLHGKLKLPSMVAAFDISLGCSGYVYGLNVLKNFMLGNKMRKGLLFTADPYSKVLNPNDYITELLFGDASTCTLLSDDPVYRIGNSLFGTDGSKHQAIKVDNQTKLLSMDGRDVFNFSMRIIPNNIIDCLRINESSIESVDLIILHQASKYIVENIRKKFGLTDDKVPFQASKYGNTVSSTIPLVLDTYMDDGLISILLCGFGVGLSWASTLLKPM